MKETILGFLKNKTVVMPTHAVKYAECANKIIIMKKGKIIKSGSYEQIKDSE
jgi:ABC-type transport system involved in cytochrome bd biosynthesis fused ATPase/permease subunit